MRDPAADRAIVLLVERRLLAGLPGAFGLGGRGGRNRAEIVMLVRLGDEALPRKGEQHREQQRSPPCAQAGASRRIAPAASESRSAALLAHAHWASAFTCHRSRLLHCTVCDKVTRIKRPCRDTVTVAGWWVRRGSNPGPLD